MSRSGYHDEYDENELNLWRGAVDRAIKGRRGQRFLRDMLEALEALPGKALISKELQDARGSVCALGAVGLKRRIAMDLIDLENRVQVADAFGIAPAMAAEIMFENDEGAYHNETPKARWLRMRDWVKAQIQGER